MSERTVLVPVDGSIHANEGFEYACSEFPDANVVVLHVVQLDVPLDDGLDTFADVEQWLDRTREEAEQIIDDAKEHATTAGHEIITELRIGRPVDVIVEYTEENDIDYIVMGSRGETDDPDTALGSVAETVLRDAPTPVSIVR